MAPPVSKREQTRRKRLAARKSHLKARYGWTLEEYDALLAFQGGRCAICGGGTSKRHLAIDHDHKTEEIRGLLCGRCNIALARFMDKLTNLRAAVAYMTDPPYRRLKHQQEEERTQMTIEQVLGNE